MEYYAPLGCQVILACLGVTALLVQLVGPQVIRFLRGTKKH